MAASTLLRHDESFEIASVYDVWLNDNESQVEEGASADMNEWATNALIAGHFGSLHGLFLEEAGEEETNHARRVDTSWFAFSDDDSLNSNVSQEEEAATKVFDSATKPSLAGHFGSLHDLFLEKTE